MELDSEYLTLNICIFEVTDAKATLTDDVAKRFSLLFPHDSACMLLSAGRMPMPRAQRGMGLASTAITRKVMIASSPVGAQHPQHRGTGVPNKRMDSSFD
jgi:hypothetical protein